MVATLAVAGAPVVAFVWWFGWRDYWGNEWAHPVLDAAVWTIAWLIVVAIFVVRVIHGRRERGTISTDDRAGD